MYRTLEGSNFFQSHFGLILSYREHHCSTVWALHVLSIPFWSDFIKTCSFWRRRLFTHFQSHFGLILSFPFMLRYDFDLSTFNPILVWFYRLFRSYHPVKLVKPFNPILVWFYPCLVRTPLEVGSLLSIPFWSDFIYSTFSY